MSADQVLGVQQASVTAGLLVAYLHSVTSSGGSILRRCSRRKDICIGPAPEVRIRCLLQQRFARAEHRHSSYSSADMLPSVAVRNPKAVCHITVDLCSGHALFMHSSCTLLMLGIRVVWEWTAC